MHRLVIACGLALMASGCGADGSDNTPPSTLPAPLERSALPELTSRDRELPRAVLAADAFAPDELDELLDHAGYVGGREREFTGHTKTFDHVVARTTSFRTPDGAVEYLRWVEAHTMDLAGRTRPLARLPVGSDAILVELEPCPTCKKQLPTLVAAWRRRAAVGYLLAAGRDVDRSTVRPLVSAIDNALP
jgi:hypothetical protein